MIVPTADQTAAYSACNLSHPPVLVFLDFDGTIATKDTGTVIIDSCMGYDVRKALDKQILDGTVTFRDAVEKMWYAVTLSWDEGMSLVSDIPLDSKFTEFFNVCIANNIPITVVSSGIQALVEHFLDHYIKLTGGNKDMLRIVANDIKIEKGGWKIIYRDDSDYGHDKGNELRLAKAKYEGLATRPIIFYAGDGVSDLSAAHEADIVFAKRGKDLETWCKKEGLAYTAWDDFSTISQVLKATLSKHIS
ncbi:hypothetical protein BATDEDRAFT_37497 [Batrachochytrium dendrobatidis JAM81]|uniref:2,3-diketo-5-methylthio-1-phosphopentane phosphatase n=2 Tax=Batrachochytrium dendrobatidis TaxID=109871 RepID=F4PCQ0_BATDJ|nr:uncharacterized protein BATDEDRAFT_37497 [Batrachochytrium dendrobatidis JAM81]EGF76984.1 hypothetical protein BATDEDRAFT_37497 [Batrachochytrium dendrobatidis JAM81]KAJ8330946.1 hypothetical protein O5D80_000965 [Batrachochytrium dendrobatidis]KAK5672479.1 hypothetical protein QVD99_001239 [Batrachochytrium dendrobatidis]OAJ44962.1 hypothetical protein BDEG_28137 [Batrachochytrium dendrobatidis JEL423]|eukprot:XP_006682465.1 hypothetical protein BATDEDRAFT_37497 [Batrachochytrium dendrobatidis JAM81]